MNQIEEPSNSCFTIYVKTNCKYCDLVKKLLDFNKIPFIEINCDKYLEDKESFLTFIENKAGRHYKTFPMVFCDGNFIGGYLETDRLIADFDHPIEF